MSETKPGRLKYVLLGGVVALAAGLFLMVGPPQLLAKSETPEFCASCHLHESHYEAWFHQGAHRSKSCVDCHLPNQNVATHYTWKSIDGMKDLFLFHSGQVPDDIRITDHGRRVVQANCIRCHEAAVEMIDQDRSDLPPKVVPLIVLVHVPLLAQEVAPRGSTLARGAGWRPALVDVVLANCAA